MEMGEEFNMRILFWPVIMIWKVFGSLVSLTSRLLVAIFALLFMLVGVILTITIVGGIIGIPLFVIGTMLLLRSLF